MSDCQACGEPPCSCRCGLTRHRDYGETSIKTWRWVVGMLFGMCEQKPMAEPRYKRLQKARDIFLKADA